MWAITVEAKVSSNANEALAGGGTATSSCPNEEQTCKHTCNTATAKTSTGAALDDSDIAWFQRKMVIRRRDVIRTIKPMHRDLGDVEGEQATRMWQDLPKQAPAAIEELEPGSDVDDANSYVQTPLSWTPVSMRPVPNDEEEEMRFPSQRQIVDGSSRRQSSASPATKSASFLKSELGSENALILSLGHCDRHEITSPGEGERRDMTPLSKTLATEHGSVELQPFPSQRNMEDADVNLRRSARRRLQADENLVRRSASAKPLSWLRSGADEGITKTSARDVRERDACLHHDKFVSNDCSSPHQGEQWSLICGNKDMVSRRVARGEDAVNRFKQGQVQLVVLRARSLSPSALPASQWRPSTAASAASATVKHVRDTKASLLRKKRGANVDTRRMMLEAIESDRGSNTQMMPSRYRRGHMNLAKGILKDRDLATDFDMKLTCLQMQQTAAQNGVSE